MEKNQVFEKLQEIFREVFDQENMIIAESMAAKDVEEWDSLTNLQLMSAIESKFLITFTYEEIEEFSNVGDICDCIMKHLTQNERGDIN